MLGVLEKECIQACQSFLWGGAGVPSYDDAGTCTCSCEGDWMAFNIVGHASCVPGAAYYTFGFVGLVFTLFHLVHAAYNLRQQRRCEAFRSRSGMVVKMLVEVYREQLSMVAIAHSFVIGLYFALTIWLPAEKVRWSGLVLGVSHSISGIGAVLTVQVLIRSVDPRLLKKDVFVLKVSAALTHPLGRCTSFCAVSVGAVFLVVLTLIDWTGQGYKGTSIAYILVTVTRIIVIIMCSRSMVDMIQKSMDRHVAKQRENGATDCGLNGTTKIVADPKLAGAKKTILSALFFCINLTSIASAVLLFALVTEYGSDNPIVFLATPLAFGPMIALTFHIQLHSKRNRCVPVQTITLASNVTINSFGSGTGTGSGRKGTVAALTGTFTGKSARHTTNGRVVPADTGRGDWEGARETAAKSHAGAASYAVLEEEV